MNTISVLIPTLNEENTIKNCLNSLLNQTEKPMEIIVVDNGSTDKTSFIVNSLKNKFKKNKMTLRLFYYPRGNQTNAREYGVKKSRGAIIGSLDADACAEKDWISKINEYFKTKEIVGIGGKSCFRNRGKIFNFLYKLGYYTRMILDLYCIGGGNSAFRKSVFFSVKGYSGLEKLRKEKNIKFPKDDYYLSKKLEMEGKLKFCPDLNVTLLQRVRNKKDYRRVSKKDIIARFIYEVIYDYRIKNYFKDKKP